MARAKQAEPEVQGEEPKTEGPEIVYQSEEAKAFTFEVNPKAKRYVVRSDGQITEEF